jgi:hypothetical protein
MPLELIRAGISLDESCANARGRAKCKTPPPSSPHATSHTAANVATHNNPNSGTRTVLLSEVGVLAAELRVRRRLGPTQQWRRKIG